MPFCHVPARYGLKGEPLEEEGLEPVDIYYRTYGEGGCKVIMIMGVAAAHGAWWPQILPLTGTDTPNELDDIDPSSSEEGGAGLGNSSASGSDEDASSSDLTTETLRVQSDLGHRLMVEGVESLASQRLPPILSPRLPGGAPGAVASAPEDDPMRPPVFERLDSEALRSSETLNTEAEKLNKRTEGGRPGCQGERKLTGRVVCVFDNRGIGRSSHPEDPKNYRTEIMARDALALADKLGWKRFHVVGHSMGGMIACKVAAIAPSRVVSLAVLSASNGGLDIIPKMDMRPWRLFARIVSARTAEERASVDLELHFSQMYLSELVDGVPRRHYLHKEYVQTLTQKGAMQPKHAQKGHLSACWNHGLSPEDVQRICQAQIPTTVVHGSDDVIAHVSLGGRIARRLGEVARFVELYGGHFIIRERQEEVNHCLVQLLNAAEAGMRGRAWAQSDPLRHEDADAKLQTSASSGCGTWALCPTAVPATCRAPELTACWSAATPGNAPSELSTCWCYQCSSAKCE